MRIVRDIAELKREQPTIVTIGNFDGVHLGHQHLMRTVTARARALGAQSAVLTFTPHTDQVVRPERQLQLLTSIEERARLIEQLGIDLLIAMPFDRALSQRSAETFMELICGHIQLVELWDGPDFRLGYRAQGTMERLGEIGTRLGYSVHAVEPFLLEGQRISSSQIRELLRAGQVDTARTYLGRCFTLQGRVVSGQQIGRTIGIPTANLAIAPEQLVPGDGIYACWAHALETGQVYRAATSIGVRPTFDGMGRAIEAHLLDFDGDLYGTTLRLAFVAWLRSEERFASVEALVQQIRADIARTEELLDKQQEK